MSSLVCEKETMSIQKRLLATIRNADPDQLLTLHALSQKLCMYAPVTIQGGLRKLMDEGEITSYEHPSFPHRPIYCMNSGNLRDEGAEG